MVVGVSALIIVNSVMSGFQETIRERLLCGNAHLIITRKGGFLYKRDFVEKALNKVKEVKSYEGFVFVSAMAVSENGYSSGASLRGCEVEKEPLVTGIPQKLIAGNWKRFSQEKNCAVIGRILAENLGVTVGDSLKFIVSYGSIPEVLNLSVCGIFEVGMYQFDSSLVLVHLDFLQKALGLEGVLNGIMVNVGDVSNISKAEKTLKKILGPSYSVQDWISLNKNLFSSLKLEKLAMFLILTLIILVASFNISSLLAMNVNAKSKDIAILKAIGAKNELVLKVFVLKGLMIGVLGTLIGELIGITISVAGEHFKVIKLPPDVYYVDHLPFKLHAGDCLLAGILAILISFLASLYPSLKAVKTDPIKILRTVE